MNRFQLIPIFALFLTLVFLTSCEKKDDNDLSSNINADYFFTGKIDGNITTIEHDPANDILLNTSTSGSLSTEHCEFSYGSGLGEEEAEDNAFSVDLLNFYSGLCQDEADALSGLFENGVYSFAENSNTIEKSISFAFWKNGISYRSTAGLQSNPYFEITESIATDAPFLKGQTVSGKISCTLYSEFGEVIELTDGLFTLHFEAGF